MSYTQAEHDGVTTNSDWAARRRRVRTEHNSDKMIQMLLLMNEYLVAAGGATCDVVTRRSVSVLSQCLQHTSQY